MSMSVYEFTLVVLAASLLFGWFIWRHRWLRYGAATTVAVYLLLLLS